MKTQYVLRVGGGNHTEHGKVYMPNDVVESEHDLQAMFPNKFDRYYAPVPPAPPVAPVPSVDDVVKAQGVAVLGTPTTTEETSEGEPDERGTNETSNFPMAADADLMVFSVGGGKYNVYDHAEKLNPKPLKGESGVIECVTKYIG